LKVEYEFLRDGATVVQQDRLDDGDLCVRDRVVDLPASAGGCAGEDDSRPGGQYCSFPSRRRIESIRLWTTA
jgi:hypothetical protein